jgi:hypothetical protein
MDGIVCVHANIYYVGQVWNVRPMWIPDSSDLEVLCDLLSSAVVYPGFVHEFLEASFF